MIRFGSSVLGVFFAMLATLPVGAATISFSGTVSGLFGDSSAGEPLIPSIGVEVGDTFTGQVEWLESGVGDIDLAVDHATYIGALVELRIQLGGQDWVANDGVVTINALADDPIQLTGRPVSGPGFGSLLPSDMTVDFDDPTDFIQSDALPSALPPFADRILPGTLSLNFSNRASGFLEIEGIMTDYTVVPEPGSALLVGLGLAALARSGRRRFASHS